MKLFKQDHEIDPSGPQPNSSLTEMKIALGIVALGTALVTGHEVTQNYNHQAQCEAIAENPSTADAQQLNGCS